MNKKLKELIELPEDSLTSEDDERLVEELKKAELIMPIEVISTDEDESFEFKPLKISNPDNQEFIPVFSDEDELVKAHVEFEVINITSENLAEMISDDECFGIAINPFSKYSLAIPLNEFIKIFK